jgi:hypothetical protein
MKMKHLTPEHIKEYIARLKWLEENPVYVKVTEQPGKKK